MTKSSSTNLCYSLFKYLWVLVLLPKEIQFFVLLGGLALFIATNKGHTVTLSPLMRGIVLYAVVHFVSIIINVLVGDYSLTRIIAAFNTCLIWIIAALYFSAIYDSDERIDFHKIAKYCLINIMILLGIYIVSKTFDIRSVNLGFETRGIWRSDWLTTGHELRFQGLLEFATLCAMFVILMAPMALIFLVERDRKIAAFAVMAVSCLLVFETNSRMGVIVIALEALCFLAFFLSTAKLSRNAKITIAVIVIAASLFFAVLKYQDIYDYIYSLLNSREGSSSTRLKIYSTSLKVTFEQSPIWGMGIKEWLENNIPLGSHCTYIGIFYKTGLLGCIFWYTGMFRLIKKLYINVKKNKTAKSNFLLRSVGVVLLVLLTSDLDGVDWLAVIFFAFIAVYLKETEESKISIESAVS